MKISILLLVLWLLTAFLAVGAQAHLEDSNGGMMAMMDNIVGSWGMMGSSSFGGFLGILLYIGLAILVWLWVIKLWKELMKKR